MSTFKTKYQPWVVTTTGQAKQIIGGSSSTLDAAKAVLRRTGGIGLDFAYFRIEKLVAAPYDETDGRGYISTDWKYFDANFHPLTQAEAESRKTVTPA